MENKTPIDRLKDGIHEGSYKSYIGSVNAFSKFTKLDQFELVKLGEQDRRKLQDYYIDWIKSLGESNGVETKYFNVKKFLDQNEIELKWKIIRGALPEKQALSGRKAYTDEDIVNMRKYNSHPRQLAWISLMSCGAFRRGAPKDMKKSDVVPIGEEAIVWVYRGHKQEHRTLLNAEAYNDLKTYWDYRADHDSPVTKDSWLFALEDHHGQLTDYASAELTRNIVIRAGLRKRRNAPKGPDSKQAHNAFRKRFWNKANEAHVQPPLINYMMGGYKKGETAHKDENYGQDMPDEILWKEFTKSHTLDTPSLASLLTIDPKQKFEEKQKQLESQKEEYQREVDAKLDTVVELFMKTYADSKARDMVIMQKLTQVESLKDFMSEFMKTLLKEPNKAGEWLDEQLKLRPELRILIENATKN